MRLVAILFYFYLIISFGVGIQDMKVLLPPVGFADSPVGHAAKGFANGTALMRLVRAGCR